VLLFHLDRQHVMHTSDMFRQYYKTGYKILKSFTKEIISSCIYSFTGSLDNKLVRSVTKNNPSVHYRRTFATYLKSPFIDKCKMLFSRSAPYKVSQNIIYRPFDYSCRKSSEFSPIQMKSCCITRKIFFFSEYSTYAQRLLSKSRQIDNLSGSIEVPGIINR